jgi:FAD/FMN-containing dehydrogenase
VTIAVDGALEQIRTIVGPSHLLSEQAVTTSYESDWTGRFGGPCLAVARPADTSQVAEILACCRRAGIGVVPQGGNTGLVGGSVPRGRGLAPDRTAAPGQQVTAGQTGGPPLVLSTRRLNEITRCDATSLLLEAGAGATLGDAQRAAGAIGYELGIDLAARDSATLGGMVATNAGGIHVIRHGPMRTRVVGLEAVLADGSVIRRMNGLWKDNVGWSLVALLAGSEGTLAVITAVSMRLVSRPTHRVTALVALSGEGQPFSSRQGAATATAVAVAAGLQSRVDGIEAVEITYPAGTTLVAEKAGLPYPPRADSADAWLTIEAAGSSDPAPYLADALANQPGVLDAAVATDSTRRRQLWAYRERHTEAIATLGVAHKLDVSLPLDRLAQFADVVGPVVEENWPGSTTICFGHVADGNLHVNVLGPPADDEAADDAVLRLALDHGGSISAEHGIGVAKVKLVAQARSGAEIGLMRSVKATLDPAGILNPGVLIPPPSS